jgi:acylphosphatase
MYCAVYKRFEQIIIVKLLRQQRGRVKRGGMESSHTRARAHLTVRGRVQGVYYRASTVYEAQNLGVTGWVQNSPDGSVAVMAEGEKSRIEDLIAWCQRGPRGARVESVGVEWLPWNGEFQDFCVKR